MFDIDVFQRTVSVHLTKGVAPYTVDHQPLGRAEEVSARIQIQSRGVWQLSDAQENVLHRVGDVVLVAQQTGEK